MHLEMFLGLGIPFLGTMLGAAVVFFLKKGVPPLVEKFMLYCYNNIHWDRISKGSAKSGVLSWHKNYY